MKKLLLCLLALMLAVPALAEGDAAKREDIRFLAPLPLFNADGSVK